MADARIIRTGGIHMGRDALREIVYLHHDRVGRIGAAILIETDDRVPTLLRGVDLFSDKIPGLPYIAHQSRNGLQEHAILWADIEWSRMQNAHIGRALRDRECERCRQATTR